MPAVMALVAPSNVNAPAPAIANALAYTLPDTLDVFVVAALLVIVLMALGEPVAPIVPVMV